MRRSLLLASALVLGVIGHAAGAAARSYHPSVHKHSVHRIARGGHSRREHLARREVHHARHYTEREHHVRHYAEREHHHHVVRHVAYRGGAWLQCVPYARRVSGVDLKGDAYRWWYEADGRYERGQEPEPGAVLSFRRSRGMELGHVAVVTETIDRRKILVSQAHWPEPGRRHGDISHAIAVIDVSRDNDWTRVRVEIGHSGRFGAAYATNGFIYNHHPHDTLLAEAGHADQAAAAAMSDPSVWTQSVQFAAAPDDAGGGIANSAPDRALR